LYEDASSFANGIIPTEHVDVISFLIPLVMLEQGYAIIKGVNYCTSMLRYCPFRIALDAHVKFGIK